MRMPERGHSGAENLAQGVLLERLALYDRALERYRAAAAAPEPAVRAEALRRESDVLRARCAWDAALERARESAYIAESFGLTDLLTEALIGQGIVWVARGDLERGRTAFRDVLVVTRTDSIRGVALLNLAATDATEGDFGAAEALFEEAQGWFERAGALRGVAAALTNRGRAAMMQGQMDRAMSHLDQALGAAQRAEDLDVVAMATLNSAECRALVEDYRRAEDLASTALGYFTTAGNHWRRVECLRLFGDMRLRQRDAATAERAYRNGLELARQIGAPVEEQVLTSRLESLVGAAD